MSNNTRRSANLVSEANIFSDIANNRVGIGTTVPTSKLTVQGDVKISGILTAASLNGNYNASGLTYDDENLNPNAFGYLSINTNKNDPNYGNLTLTKVINHNENIDIFELDIYADYIGPGTFTLDETTGFLNVVF